MEGTRSLDHDHAISPVMGTILMVAIAVVLAAPVYSWATGLGASREEPARAMTLSSTSAAEGGTKEFAVASATPGLRWSDLEYSLDGVPLAYDAALDDDGDFCVAAPGMACVAGTSTPSALIGAGDLIRIHDDAMAGKTVRVVDPEANAVVLTFTLRSR